MCGADCGVTRALGFLCCGVQYGRIPGQQQQGFIHHLVSYTVTHSRETGYSLMRISSSVEYYHPKCAVLSEVCTSIALVGNKVLLCPIIMTVRQF